MKVLLNDGLHEEGIRLFEDAGIETDTRKRNLERLIKEIGKYDALIVRSATKVTRAVIEAGADGSLIIIGRAGVGYDNIDVDAASKRGIIAKTAPFGNTNAAAELALFLMGNCSRKIPQAHYSLKDGVWPKESLKGNELSHKTLGIIGCGRIGQRLSQLTIGFDMKVIGFDEYLKTVKTHFPESRIEYRTKKEVLRQSDYISIHASGEKAIIGAEELSMMKSTAYLVNVARGYHVDEKALYKALKTGKIAGAGLDVYSEEPSRKAAKFESKFRELENVVMSSHLGASTEEAQRKTARGIAEVIIGYLQRGDFLNAVNVGESIESEQIPVYPLFIHHTDKPGVFTDIGQVLKKYGINIRENPSRQVKSEQTDGKAVTVYLLHQPVNPNIIKEISNLPNIKRVRSPN